ncbi:hypothetical protein [Paracoccus chinensis]|uniref:hypothetical protein n=1 Tax=Paracoccus chinensis TaxID=525640 RepID=UPI003CCC2AE2
MVRVTEAGVRPSCRAAPAKLCCSTMARKTRMDSSSPMCRSLRHTQRLMQDCSCSGEWPGGVYRARTTTLSKPPNMISAWG